MKKLYAILMMLCISAAAFAAKSTLNVGYPINNEYVYSYDGFGGLEKDTKIGAAIFIPRSMVECYIGATIKSLRIGWADPEATVSATTFIRSTLNGEDIAKGAGTLKDARNGSWNTIKFDTPYPITEDFEGLYVGYQCTLPAGSWGVSNMYPHEQEGSAFLSREGINDEEGNLLWEDLHMEGTLSIQLVIEGELADFSGIATPELLRRYPVGKVGEAGDGILTLTNKGMNTINKVTLTYTCGEVTQDHDVTLGTPLAKGGKSTFGIPVYTLGTGIHKVSVSKINGKENKLNKVLEYHQIGVPEEVALKYERRPLVEYIESENAWNSVKYYDEYLAPGLEDFRESVSLLACHFDDQFMNGENDELKMLLDLCANDSSRIFVPTFMIDRSQMVLNTYDSTCSYAPWASGVLLPNFVGPVYQAALDIPTFASVNADVTLDREKMEGSVTIKGDVSAGVLDADSKLGLVVFLVEDNVNSDSQLMDQQKGDKKVKDEPIKRGVKMMADDKDTPVFGHVIHQNVSRSRLTPIYGDPITSDGPYEKTYQFYLEDEWKLADMRVIAFLCFTPQKEAHWRGNVVNSTEFPFTSCTGISKAPVTKTQAASIIDIQGRRVNAATKGIYIVDGHKVIR